MRDVVLGKRGRQPRVRRRSEFRVTGTGGCCGALARHRNPKRDAYRYQRPHVHGYAVPNGNRYGHCHIHAQSDAYAQPNGHADAYRDCHRHADIHQYSDSHCDGYRHAYAYQHRHAYRNCHRDTYANIHQHPDAYRDCHRHADSNQHPDAYRYAHSHTDANAQIHDTDPRPRIRIHDRPAGRLGRGRR